MLWRILQAHGGKLPEDVVVCFANTGLEADETLSFVQECSEQWDVPIKWVEYGRETVEYSNASRRGEPFALLIERRKFLPNPVMRFCTQELKINLIQKAAPKDAAMVVGIRYDEPRRKAKLSDGRIAPLFDARITEREVEQFWRGMFFDLQLPYRTHSNCTLCFLKGAGLLRSLIREKPARAMWWIEQEQKVGARFRSDRPSYGEMRQMALSQGEMFAFDDEALQDCACTD